MASLRWGIVGLGIVWLIFSPKTARADSPQSAAEDREIIALADRIDEHLASNWAARAVRPTYRADDAEFLRRVSLDLIGRIPTVWDLRKFLDDPSPDKRAAVVRRLLNDPRYVEYFTGVWRAQMLPQNNDQQVRFLAQNIESWLRKRFRDNTAYDQMVRELLTATVAETGPGYQRGSGPDPAPLAFYQVNESKAENLAASTSRLFLGIKLECAQCHDHPFAKWSKKQFWEYAAFFSGIQPREPRFGIFSPIKDDPAKRVIKMAGTDKEIEARFLDGKAPPWKDKVGTRTTLAEWMTARDNPYFARNAVNRLWAHFFGIGIVEPVDEPSSDNPPSHPELLDELTRGFVAHQYDLKFLIRVITSSRTYQLSSAITELGQNEPRLFARMAVKGLSGEQLFDSLAVATGYQERGGDTPRNPFFTARADFLAKFNNPSEKRTEFQTSILQALSLMNGKFTSEVTNAAESKDANQTLTLIAVLDAPFLDTTAKRVETLYLAALSRKPRPEELERFVKYVERGGPSGDTKKALADVFWALLNSSEFILNH